MKRDQVVLVGVSKKLEINSLSAFAEESSPRVQGKGLKSS